MSKNISAGKVKIASLEWLDVMNFRLTEKVNEPLEIKVELQEFTSKFSDLVGKLINFEFSQENIRPDKSGKFRNFSAIVTEVNYVIDTHSYRRVEIRAISKIGLLKYSQSCEIYQNLTSVKIVEKLLSANGISLKINQSGSTTPKLETCIQYNENDFDFCKRILADDGLVFYNHDGVSGEKLYIHNSASPFPKNNAGSITLKDNQTPDRTLYDIEKVSLSQSVICGGSEILTYDFDSSSRKLGVSKTKANSNLLRRTSKTEFILHPDVEALPKLAKRQSASFESTETLLCGETEHPGLHIGQELEIKEASDRQFRGKYIICEIIYSSADDSRPIVCNFAAVLKTSGLTPKRIEKPLIHGVHNAVVTGSKSGEPSCDKQGRVKVNFFWDKSKQSTTWLRVAEQFAGSGYGMQFSPRTGQEVLVSFIGGDPDCPIITGQVYNSKNKPPFSQANTTKSGVTTKMSGKPNELIFDDKKNSENVTLNAAKDLNLNATNDFQLTTKKTASCTAEIFEIEAKELIRLKVGSSIIELTSSGVKLEGSAINLNAKNKFVLEGANGDIKAKSQLNFQGANIDSKAKMGLKLEGLTISAKAKTALKLDALTLAAKAKASAKVEGLTVNIKAQTIAELKGSAMSKIDAGGLAMVKGALVKIN